MFWLCWATMGPCGHTASRERLEGVGCFWRGARQCLGCGMDSAGVQRILCKHSLKPDPALRASWVGLVGAWMDLLVLLGCCRSAWGLGDRAEGSCRILSGRFPTWVWPQCACPVKKMRANIKKQFSNIIWKINRVTCGQKYFVYILLFFSQNWVLQEICFVCALLRRRRLCFSESWLHQSHVILQNYNKNWHNKYFSNE